MKGAKPTVLKVIQGGIVDAPPPPEYLPKSVHNDWYVVTSDLASRKLLAESTLSVVETYCFALYQLRESQKSMAKDGVFIRSKDGMLKRNPAISMSQKAQDTVSRLSVELGLTPSARSRKGLNGPEEPQEEGINKFV